MALHAEDRRWWWYARDRELFGGMGFGGPEWDWMCDPVNTAVVYLADAALQRRYADTALRFMGACSEPPSATGIPPNAMLFAEQRLLPMCAHQMGRPLAFITTLQGGPAWLPCGADCLHLWGAKQAYKLCPEARVAAVNHLRARILRRFPIARPTLNRWGLAEPILTPEPDPAQRTTVLCAPPEGLTFSLLREVQGRVWVKDRVTGARRLAVEDGMIWSGEELEPEPGASCVLLVGGTQSLRLGACAATVSERSCYATAN
jgi:hypothetical protein